MQVGGRDACGVQLAGQFAGRVLGAGEEQAPTGARCQLGDDRGLVGGLHIEQVVLEQGGRSVRRIDRMHGGVAQVALHQR